MLAEGKRVTAPAHRKPPANKIATSLLNFVCGGGVGVLEFDLGIRREDQALAQFIAVISEDAEESRDSVVESL
jgi:hypothetical protein